MLSKALRLLRTVNELSQGDLAKELSISGAYLSQIESGKKKPTTDLIEKYAAIFQLPVSTLWLFSETLKSNTIGERSRVFAADKMLRIIEALTCNPEEERHESKGVREDVSSKPITAIPSSK